MKLKKVTYEWEDGRIAEIDACECGSAALKFDINKKLTKTKVTCTECGKTIESSVVQKMSMTKDIEITGKFSGYDVIEDNTIKEIRLPKEVIEYLKKCKGPFD